MSALKVKPGDILTNSYFWFHYFYSSHRIPTFWQPQTDYIDNTIK